MSELEYYKFCNKCLGSSHDLLVDWKKKASSVCCKDAQDGLLFARDVVFVNWLRLVCLPCMCLVIVEAHMPRG